MASITRYVFYAVSGFAICAGYEMWSNFGFSPDSWDAHDIAVMSGYGFGGAIAGMIVCWFL